MSQQPPLNRAVKVGIAWLAVERGTIQVLTLASSMVLARLLSPTDFGVLGIATLFTGLSTRLAKLGFGMAIVQRETIRPDHVATLFVTTLVINTAVCLSLVGVSPFVGTYFESALVGQVLAVLSLNYLVRCLGTCPSALLRRYMNFRALTIGAVADAIVKLVVAGTLGWRGYGVWALVYAELAGGLADKVVLVVASGWRPSLRATRLAFNELFRFGLGVSMKSSFIYFSDNVDNFITGKWLGPAALGIYEKAYRLMDLPVKEMSSRMGGVLFPAFSRIQGDSGRLRAAFRKTTLALALIGYPVFGTLATLAPAVIAVMYGSRWVAVALPFQILCLAGPPRMLVNVMSSAINATGSIGPEVKRRAVLLVLLAAGASAGTRWGTAGVATAVTLVNFVGLVLVTILLCRVASMSLWREVARPQLIPLGATAALVVVERAVALWADGAGLHPLALLALASTAGGAVYLVAVLLLRDEALSNLLGELDRDLRPLTRRWLPAFVRGRRQDAPDAA